MSNQSLGAFPVLRDLCECFLRRNEELDVTARRAHKIVHRNQRGLPLLQRQLVHSPRRYAAAGSRDGGDILIWELSSGRLVQELQGHAATVNSVEFAPDGRGLVSGSDDGTARFWRVG